MILLDLGGEPDVVHLDGPARGSVTTTDPVVFSECEERFEASFSDDENANCVEVADLPEGARAVRDSKSPNGGVLWFTGGKWNAFVKGVRAGEFD